MNAVLLINPASGQRDPRRSQHYLERQLRQQGTEFTTTVLDASSDFTAVARDAASSRPDVVIVAGGDGTIGSVAAGLANSGVPLGIIPLGTSCALAKNLHIPQHLGQALQVALGGQRRRLDLGHCNRRRFLITAGVGLDAEAFRRVDPRLKKIAGQVAYYGTFIQTLLEFRPKEVTVDWGHGRFQGPAYLVMVVNCDPSAGTPLRLAPDASPSDGLLDVLIFGARPPFDLPRKLGLAVLGQLVKDPTVHHYRTRTVTVTAPTAVPVELDGDYRAETPVAIGIEPGAVEVKVP